MRSFFRSAALIYALSGLMLGLLCWAGAAMLAAQDDTWQNWQELPSFLSAAHRALPALYIFALAPLVLSVLGFRIGWRLQRLTSRATVLEQLLHDRSMALSLVEEEARQAQETVAYVADHDAHTGLLNRRRFQKEVLQWTAHALRYRHVMALMFVDLDKFKDVNDTYGHAAGDRYLATVADILRKAFRATDHLARWGGDEFAILLPETQGAQAMEVANKLLKLFNDTTLEYEGRQIPMSASIGISLFPTHTRDANEFIAFADAAMYEAKEAGRHCWRLYSASPEEIERAQENIRWEGRLRRALETDQFVLLYQPVLDIASGKTFNYEALLRLEDRDGQLISPRLFLDAAEQFSLSVPLDRMVIRKAARKLTTLGAEHAELRLSLNLSRPMLVDSEFISFLRDSVVEAGVSPNKLGFEISENIALENLGEVRALATQLKLLGHPLILDEFGRGFSSLHYLQQLGADMLKIEGALIRDLRDHRENRRFLRTMTAMAHELGIKVAAKFVEDPELLEVLRELGIDYAQGFAIGRPLESIEQTVLSAREGAS